MKQRAVIILGFLLIVLLILGFIFRNKLGLLTIFPFTQPSVINSYCSAQNKKTQEFLVLEKNPTEFIANNSTYNAQLTRWKNILISENGWNEDYFNQHIRIKGILLGSYESRIYVDYMYLIDWATFESIYNRIDETIDSIQVTHFPPQQIHIKNCNELIYTLLRYNTALTSDQINVSASDKKLGISSNWPKKDKSNICSYVGVDMTTNKILTAKIENHPCVIPTYD
ncbi:TPA: hypothetical protein DIV55_00355 [Patescibacteria group bacterium]|uniref:Uncharacterized protein n=1 Tax=Candidatus Gottesmanbacteria bacterium GW2011_GWA1_43_11 TaxID=1618436 RepID=A0A0G1EMC1_9BACT|nr:MAG: hypothetical protein UV59_C0025G0002 [Candidatus Gottesmanbacteria bacterium GW2011_GWA1_43_11]HCS78178.1 hypothetical protein [Patescibacteria group bacterium]